MEVLVCIKRVPMVGGRIAVTADGLAVDTKMLGFTVSPHEECAVEEAIRLTERHGGSVTVLTLGPPEAAEQLRDALALGAHRAVLLETDGREWGPAPTATAIVAAIREREAASGPFDLLLFGNEAADSADYQVGIRVARALGRPCATGIKQLEVTPAGGAAGAGSANGSGPDAAVAGGTSGAGAPGRIVAKREHRGAVEAFSVELPAVVTVKEGINLPRYPSLPGRMRARKAPLESRLAPFAPDPLERRALRVPTSDRKGAEILGRGAEAVPALVALLDEMGVLS